MTTAFWSIVAVMLGVALAFLLPPLLRRQDTDLDVPRSPDITDSNVEAFRSRLKELDAARAAGDLEPEAYEEARADLERALLEDTAGAPQSARRAVPRRHWVSAALIAIAVPGLAVGLYLHVGNPGALDPLMYRAPVAGHPGQVDQMVHRLEEHLKRSPDDGDGWLMLGRSYSVLKRYAAAAKAYSRAHALLGDRPELLAAWAEADAHAHGNSLLGEPSRLLDKALELQPDNERALWLGGFAALQAGKRDLALQRWEKLEGLMPPGTDPNRVLATLIARLQGVAPPTANAGSGTGVKPRAQSTARIEAKVSLTPALASRVKANDTVFIFAQAAGARGMPLAVTRTRVAALPVVVRLDDSLAMTPARRLSKFHKVVVVARVSPSGQPLPSAGDLQGASSPVDPDTDPTVRVVIDHAIP